MQMCNLCYFLVQIIWGWRNGDLRPRKCARWRRAKKLTVNIQNKALTNLDPHLKKYTAQSRDYFNWCRANMLLQLHNDDDDDDALSIRIDGIRTWTFLKFNTNPSLHTQQNGTRTSELISPAQRKACVRISCRQQGSTKKNTIQV